MSVLIAAFNKKIQEEMSAKMHEPAEPGRIWSPQQEALFAWFASPAEGECPQCGMVHPRHLVCRARAGTGKSTTIREGVKRAPEADGGDIKVSTLHGVGYACVRLYREKVRVEERAGLRQARLAEAVCGGQAPDAIKRLVGRLLTKAREMAPLAAAPADLLDIALEFECEPDEAWSQAGFDLAYVQARAVEALALAANIQSGEEIDFADMLFLPVVNGWLRPQYDLVVVDEAQDMTLTQLTIARGVCRGRLAVVGDDRQAIYAFRGADKDSLDRLKAELHAEEMGLTVTRRCAAAIVAVAQTLVPDIQAAPDAPAGEVSSLPSVEKLVAEAAPQDFILSRTNAPLARVAMALIRANKPARIQGKDIGAGLVGLVRRLATGKAANSLPEFLARLAKWEERECEKVIRADRPERAEGIRDKAETLRVVCDGVTGLHQLQARLEDLFSDKTNGGAVVCSSVHKAKGLEAPKVFVLRSTLYPKFPEKAKPSPARLQEEQNIHYVAVTRAMRHLVMVEGK